jgi:methionyl-tRNA formyltransferase
MRVIFMGSPEFSVPVLEALVAAGHEIAAVYCQPPRPAGRGKKDRPTPVHAKALALGLTVRHPESLRGEDEQKALAALEADIAVVVAYGLILPQAVLDAPKQGCLNIHASLLPRWRGAAPIHRAIMARDEETGVCIMQMEAGLDTGPVLLREVTPIAPDDTTGSLHDRLSRMGADLIVRAMDTLPDLVPVPQPDEGVSYAAKIDKSETRVDWSWMAVEVDAHIRGLSPFPGAWTEYEGERLKLLLSEPSEVGARSCGLPGQLLDNALTVACGRGSVRLLRLQRAGRGAQDADEFLRGMAIRKGAVFR